MGLTLPQIFNRKQAEEPGDHLSPEPDDALEYWTSLLEGQSLDWQHNGATLPGYIKAVMESPYLPDRGDLVALWYAHEPSYALDYIPVEQVWELVVSQ